MNKIRATILDISGQERSAIIKAVISRYNTAINHCFYLEATSLIESLICDRLESRLGELSKKPIQFNTIGLLLKQLNLLEIDPLLTKIMNSELKEWSFERNNIIHQAAKIEVGKKKDWNNFILDAEKTAKNGKKYFDNYNKQLQKLRLNKQPKK